jgi:hypothetical protein
MEMTMMVARTGAPGAEKMTDFEPPSLYRRFYFSFEANGLRLIATIDPRSM